MRPETDCPRCACQQADLVDQRQRKLTSWENGAARSWLEVVRRWRCTLCRRTFWTTTRVDAEAAPPAGSRPRTGHPTASADGPPAQAGPVVYPAVVIRCPACGSTDTRVRSTQRPVRYHRCAACGATFKSVESPG